MPLFKVKNQLVLFVHIPKTGGSSVEEWLSQHSTMWLSNQDVFAKLPCPPQHMHAKLMEDMGLVGLSDYSFSIVRDPVERLLSQFFYMNWRKFSEAEPFRKRLPWRSKQRAMDLYFEKWIRLHLRIASQNRSHQLNHLRPQSEFLGDDLDHIFKLEDGLEVALAKVASELGIEGPKDTPHILASKRLPVRISLECLNRIDAFYENDFDVLQYSKASTRPDLLSQAW